jgi:hypothetical protein
MNVSADEKLLLACYRIDEALRDLEDRQPLSWFDRLFRRRRLGVQGYGWASAHHALQKAKAALGLELGPDDALMNRKPEVKAIEARLYNERREY